jgi:hypothetical protein
MKTFDEMMVELTERKALGLAQRRKLGMRMRRLAKSSTFQAKVQRKRMRLADPAALKSRAMKQAKSKVIQKFSGMDKSDYMDLPVQQRIEIDNRIVAKKGAFIQKIAKKLLQKVKKAEMERLKDYRQSKADT